MSKIMRAISYPVYVSAALVWLGMIVGISFLATPVKFTAPSLSLPVALDVGRVTFGFFSKVEWGLFAVLVFMFLLSGWKAIPGVIIFFLAAILLAEMLWLLPEFNSRVAAIIAGNPQPPSLHHAVYAVLEAIKASMLAGLAIDYFLRFGSKTPS